jgi:hypothetical protein
MDLVVYRKFKFDLRRICGVILGVAACAAVSSTRADGATAYLVTVDTTSVTGTSGFLDLQFNPGNITTQSATARVTNFSIDGGSLTGVPSIVGDVSGSLPAPATFINGPGLNDYFHSLNYGVKYSFVLLLSGPAIDSPDHISTAGSTFCLAMYDTALNPILTNQANGCAWTVDINLDGSTTSRVYPNGTGPTVVSSVQITVSTDSYQVGYASNLAAGDTTVNLTNTGVRNGFDPAGGVCVNVYAFDPSEELVACCSCYVSPDGLRSVSVKEDLISNTLTPGVPSSVVIKLLGSAPITGACSASSPTVTNLVGGTRAWGTSLHQNATAGGYKVTENVFQNSVLSESELSKLTTYCEFIQANASGFGICKSCRLGGLGGDKR